GWNGVADRVAGARWRLVAAGSHRHRPQPSPGARLDGASGRNHRAWQGRGTGRAVETAAAIPDRGRLCRRPAATHGRRRLDPVLRKVDAEGRRLHLDEFAETARWTGDL